MPRLPADRNPKLTRHKPTGQGRVRITGRDHYLGSWPVSFSDPPPAVLAAYHRAVAAWHAAGRPSSAAAVRPAAAPVPADGLTVDEIILRYLDHCDAYYRDPDGLTTSEPADVRLSVRPLAALYGPTPARDFGPKAFKAVRDEMVRAGLCRRIVNQRAARVKRLFRWAVAEELVPPGVGHGVAAVEPLKPGRSAARESPPVPPVPVEHVERTLPYLTRPVAAMVRVQLLAGCRPGEVVQMRTADLTMAGDVWTYRPARHKGRWRGKPRVIYLGPRAQAVLAPFLRPAAPLAYLFSPAAAMAEFRDRQKAARKTPLIPAQVWTPVADPKRRPGESYSGKSYAKAVEKACKKAGVPAWCPLQLRHTAGTDARRIAGLDGAQVTLGHASADISQVYAERRDDLALRVAKERG